MVEEEIIIAKKEEEIADRTVRSLNKGSWEPKTDLGKRVKRGDIADLKYILENSYRILEADIVDFFITDLNSEFIEVGQSKGKFGGGKRSIWKQTQKKTKEGNKPKFSTFIVVGNKNGYVGLGKGKAKETVPARTKALRDAKLNIIVIKRGCGSWECGCREPHSIPFKVRGKSGSVIIELKPAPKGSGLVTEKECKKILGLAGIKDVYSKTFGQTGTKMNLAKACFAALKELSKTKIKEDQIKRLGIV
ncbi:30S ribosomal protein S5 [Candidatus Woesearchaeota archaeon]|nr:30S ribosomal protein S5 [Candidatus Woesearchaeota archaeon]